MPTRTLTDSSAGDLSTDLIAASSPAFEAVVPEWRALWVQAPDREPYSHPGWVAAYWAAFEPAAEPLVLTVRLRGRLVAVLPLIRESTVVDGMPVRLLRAPMNPHSFRVQLLTASDVTMRTPCAICDHLACMGGWDLLSIGRFPRAGAADRLGHCLRCHGFPAILHSHSPTRFIAIPDAASGGGDEPWMQDVDGDLKKKVRRAWRQISQDFRSEPELETIDAADPEALTRFYEIEASGWKGREGTAIKCAPETLGFYNAVARAFAADRALRLHVLRVQGVAVAGAFSVVTAHRLFVLKWSYDETYAKYRPGQLLSREMLRDCSQRGLREMDLGEDAAYKREWTPRTEDHEYLYVFNRTLYGRLLYGYREWMRPALGRLRRRWYRDADASQP